MLRSLLALLLLGACAHGLTTSTAVRFAATDEVTTMALRESITRSLRDVRPFSSCRIERGESSAFDRAQVVETETGRRGMEIFTESLVFTSATAFTVRVGFFQHADVSGQWMCAGRQTASGWRVDRCDDE